MYLMIYWLEVITSSGRARYMHYNREPNIFPLGPSQLSQLAFYHNDRHFSVVFFSSFSSAFCKTVCRDSCLMFPSTSARGRSRHMIKTRKKKSPFPISLHSWLERRSRSCQSICSVRSSIWDHTRMWADSFRFLFPGFFLEGLNGVIDFTANGYGKVWPKYG